MFLRLRKKVFLIAALFPIWLIVVISFFINEIWFLFTWPIRILFHKPDAQFPPLKKEASIVILNWNGRSVVEECLPTVVEAVRYDGGDHEILLVDNGSTDDSIEWVQERFPEVRIIRFDKNYGFVRGNNLGVKEARKDILVFLNNDMAVKKDFLRPLLNGFQDENVFAVSSQIFFHDSTRRREETGKTRSVWFKGMIGYSHDLPTDMDFRDEYVPAFWFGGGSAAIDRRKFEALGGFDTLHSPFYMEDVDLSYMAWKRGWKVLFCPVSEVIHKHRTSTGRFNRAYVERVIHRNRFLFIWKNITHPVMVLEHLIALLLAPLRLSWVLNSQETIQMFLMALQRLPLAMHRRNQHRLYARVNDREIFKVTNSRLDYRERYNLLPATITEKLRILMITAYFPNLGSGGGVRLYQLVKSLAQKHEVTLLSFWDDPSDLNYFDDMERICKEVITIRRFQTTASFAIPVVPPAIRIDFGDKYFHSVLERMLLENEYDVIQTEFFQMGHQVPITRRSIRVLTHHEVQSSAAKTRQALETGFAKSIYLKMQWARWLNADIRQTENFDHLVTLTPEDAWAINRYAPHIPIEVIGTGIDLEYFKPSPGCLEEPNSLVYVGNFRHPPNIDSALFLVNKILPLVKLRVPDIKLFLVGANPPPVIQDLSQDPNVVVTGWVDDLRSIVYRANAYVFPIITGTGLRNKILEAMAVGKPIISTQLGIAGIHATHKKDVWIAESPEEFADAITYLLVNEEMRETLGSNARKYVEQHHNWESIADQYVQLYKKCIDLRRRESMR